MQILWNGVPSEEFRPSRGIRQGDPISPYLFVLCIERLAHAIQNAVHEEKWKPISVGRGRVQIPYLLFADDLLLFLEASVDQEGRTLLDLMGFTMVEDLGTYLGVPIIHGRTKNNTYERIIERAEKRLSGWKANSLSVAGRVVLNQSVVSSLPYFTMQSVRLPNSICEGLESDVGNFSGEARGTNVNLA
ncbi:Uncharacterized mitochondrial protein AtMg01250 [Striga hermonthica]|uniref:Uncharacterized mitochondrial protein AtMg01250 n=1 Tax=Striga hermonthica TaxID=68872 RepID=A0A9N7MHP5_STRHE|nr:Uncharacterized mitochondrial protein AtMg01250 [Striga hermonthica]